MKSKELVRLIQEMDPEGETEICVGNQAISYLDPMPAYYDGRLQMIETDKNGRAVSAKYVSGGYKIKIKTFDIEDEIWDDLDFPVYFDQDVSGHLHQQVEEMRARAREYYEQNPEYKP